MRPLEAGHSEAQSLETETIYQNLAFNELQLSQPGYEAENK